MILWIRLVDTKLSKYLEWFVCSNEEQLQWPMYHTNFYWTNWKSPSTNSVWKLQIRNGKPFITLDAYYLSPLEWQFIPPWKSIGMFMLLMCWDLFTLQPHRTSFGIISRNANISEDFKERALLELLFRYLKQLDKLKFQNVFYKCLNDFSSVL